MDAFNRLFATIESKFMIKSESDFAFFAKNLFFYWAKWLYSFTGKAFRVKKSISIGANIISVVQITFL
jgi:hypothetical protein